MSMGKQPIRRTPEEVAAQRAADAELQRRIRGIKAELEASGSVYATVPDEDLLAFAISRIEAELAAKP